MNLRILGCSGGIGQGRRTTCLMIDDDILIDAGSGISVLTLDEMARIRHIFMTHSHLDHVTHLPLMVDSIFDRIKSPVVIHGQAATLKALQDHIFNWHIWPDFAKLPTADRPVMAYQEMLPGTKTQIGKRTLEMIPVNHIVPAVGYRVQSESGRAFAFSGDTATNETFWSCLNSYTGLELLIVEAAFCNADEELSRKARHYCSKTLAEDLIKLKVNPRPEVYISHNKPGDEADIFREVTAALPDWNLKPLLGNDRFEI